MTPVLFCMPIKPGKLQAYKDFVKNITGPRQAEYKDLLKRYGLNSGRVWVNSIDGKDYAMFIHDMDDDAGEKLQAWSSSSHPFDQWFNEQLMYCYDMTSLDNAPPQPEFLAVCDARD